MKVNLEVNKNYEKSLFFALMAAVVVNIVSVIILLINGNINGVIYSSIALVFLTSAVSNIKNQEAKKENKVKVD